MPNAQTVYDWGGKVGTRHAVSAKRQMQLFDLLQSILADTARRVPTLAAQSRDARELQLAMFRVA
ncbi:MAG TPA: hypothetical protein DC009_02370 [Porphyromonadaceae bacterium]|nr:hypothetical protein [Porphyromonadaceae bacterium]